MHSHVNKEFVLVCKIAATFYCFLRKNTDSRESAHNLRIACGKISITVNTINAFDCFEMQMFCFIAGVAVFRCR